MPTGKIHPCIATNVEIASNLHTQKMRLTHMPNVTVTIEPNRFGHYLVISSEAFKLQNIERAHDGGYALKHGAYLQTSNEIEHLMENLSAYCRRQLDKGYPVKARVYDEVALCWFNIEW